MTQVREPPDVPQAYAEAHLGQDILQLGVPGWTVLPLSPATSHLARPKLGLHLALVQPVALLRVVGGQWRLLCLERTERKAWFDW